MSITESRIELARLVSATGSCCITPQNRTALQDAIASFTADEIRSHWKGWNHWQRKNFTFIVFSVMSYDDALRIVDLTIAEDVHARFAAELGDARKRADEAEARANAFKRSFDTSKANYEGVLRQLTEAKVELGKYRSIVASLRELFQER